MEVARFFLARIKENKTLAIFLLIVLGFLFANLTIVVHPARLSGDGVSLVLMATAPLREIGVPYRDYWEYKPPGTLLLISSWVKVFSSSMFSFKILQTLFLLGVGILTYFVLKKIFSPFYTLVVGILAIVVFYSPYLNFYFLAAEPFGLFFSLAGLLCLLYLKGESRYFFSALLLAISGQMKEPFNFTFLALLPPLFYLLISRNFRSFFRSVIFVAGGFLFVTIVALVYLSHLGALKSYLEVLSFKSQIYNVFLWVNPFRFMEKFDYTLWHAKNILLFFQLPALIILEIWLLSLFLFSVTRKKFWLGKGKKTKKHYLIILRIPTIRSLLPLKFSNTPTVLFYSLGSLIGFTIQGNFDFHYLMQIVLPIFFFWAIIFKSIFENFERVFQTQIFRFLLIPISILFLFPKPAYIKGYDLQNYNLGYNIKRLVNNIKMVNSDTGFENYLASRTSKNACILSVYGWSVGETYYYAKRRPCTRFFLVNIANHEWQKKEYRESLLENPPQALIYTLAGADMNVEKFEREVINLTQIKAKCYQVDLEYPDLTVMNRSLYFPKFQGNNLKRCLEQNSTIATEVK